MVLGWRRPGRVGHCQGTFLFRINPEHLARGFCFQGKGNQELGIGEGLLFPDPTSLIPDTEPRLSFSENASLQP
jgi:hypothetical protein